MISEFGWLVDRNIARLRPPQNEVNLAGTTAREIGKVEGIGHEPTYLDQLAIRIYRRRSALLSKFDDEPPVDSPCLEP
jgi:hypothetical protein